MGCINCKKPKDVYLQTPQPHSPKVNECRKTLKEEEHEEPVNKQTPEFRKEVNETFALPKLPTTMKKFHSEKVKPDK